MKTNSILTLFCLALLFSCCRMEDETPVVDTISTDQGMASFEVVLCTDVSEDPTCTENFLPVVGAKIQLFNTLDDLEFGDPILAESLTLGEGTTSFSNLPAGNIHYKVLANVDTLASVFGVNNNAAAQVRVEFTQQ